jgi:hypothetical protein
LDNYENNNNWFNGNQGNFFSDYLDKYPNAKESPSHQDVWDIPYGIEAEQDPAGDPAGYDKYPLMHRIYTDTVVPAPSIPSLIAPAENANLDGDTVKLLWTSVEDATAYRLQAAFDTSFSSPLINGGRHSDNSFTMNGLEQDTIYYWRVLSNNSGIISGWSDVWQFSTGTPTNSKESLQNNLPESYVLYQNFPNPFRQKTTIQYDVPETCFIELVIFNMVGKEVTKLVSRDHSPGTYIVEWDAADFTSGIYFYRFETDRSIKGKRLLKLK